jgi:hypothetical protein
MADQAVRAHQMGFLHTGGRSVTPGASSGWNAGSGRTPSWHNDSANDMGISTRGCHTLSSWSTGREPVTAGRRHPRPARARPCRKGRCPGWGGPHGWFARRMAAGLNDRFPAARAIWTSAADATLVPSWAQHRHYAPRIVRRPSVARCWRVNRCEQARRPRSEPRSPGSPPRTVSRGDAAGDWASV